MTGDYHQEKKVQKTMDPMMSRFLRNTTEPTSPDNCDKQLDLSINQCTKHTCDPVLKHEDLRQDIDAVPISEPKTRNSDAPCRDSGLDSSETGADGSNSESSLDSCEDIADVEPDIAEIKQEAMSPQPKRVHPFSIEALIGDADDTSPSAAETAPAIVSSEYSAQFEKLDLMNFQGQMSGSQNFHVSTPTSRDVSNHMSYWCHVCNILCVDADDAKNHVYCHHYQRAQCNLQKSLFGIHGYVSKHTNLDNERIQCGICDKVMAYCFFSRHQRFHDGHVCDVCYKEFSSISRLQDHMNVHTNTTPFRCTICDRRFSKRTSFTQHYRYHRNHDSFKCDYCYKSFNSKYTKDVHERLHTGEKPFKCTVTGCSKAFPQKVQLKLHMSSHKE